HVSRCSVARFCGVVRISDCGFGHRHAGLTGVGESRYDKTMTIRPKDRKLAELILFISERSEGDPRFGAGKLNKLLFYSDFGSYRLLGKSITGQQYQKLSNGPAPRRLAAVRDALVARHELAIREKESV